MADINDIDEGLAKRIMSLLAMAKDSRTNENEAANAMRAAQRLADAHNLSLANLDPASRKAADKRREDKKFNGGLYQWQRDLYRAIAELNHCRHWVDEEEVPGKVSAYEKRKYGAEDAKWRAENGYSNWGREWRHRVLGSPVNVLSTQMMAEYLQDTVERLARDYVGNDPKRFFIQDAIAFREGVCERVCQMLRDKRYEDVREQRRQRAEQAARTGGTANALVILDDVIEAEREANYDYLYGEGSFDREVRQPRLRREAAERERKAAAEEAARIQAQWEKDHPEEAAKLKAQQAREAAEYYERQAAEAAKAKTRKASVPRARQMTDAERRRYSGAFYDGSQAGSKVSLDKQVESKTKGLLK